MVVGAYLTFSHYSKEKLLINSYNNNKSKLTLLTFTWCSARMHGFWTTLAYIVSK